MSTRYRGNFLYGTLSGYNATQTTFTGTGFPTNNLTTGTYLPIVLNPGYNGATASGEIVYVTNIGAGGVITVSSRGGVEGTTAGSGSNGTQWVAGPLASDFGFTNQISNGDFPAPSSSGQVFVSTSTSNASWGQLPASGIAAGSAGQILVTSGTTTVWKAPTAWSNADPSSYGNQYNGTTTCASITVSGYSTYLLYGRANVWSTNGTSSTPLVKVYFANHSSPTTAVGEGGDDYYSRVLDQTKYNNENSSTEHSSQVLYKPGTTAAVTIDFIVTTTTNVTGVNVYAGRGFINVVGIA